MSQMKNSSPVQLKFCGLTDASHFQVAEELGIDFCGINLVPTSVRFVPTEKAVEVTRFTTTRNVLICRDPTVQAVIEMVREIKGVVAIQLHGHELPEFIQQLRLKIPPIEIWKALPLGGSTNVIEVERYRHVSDLILFDSGPISGSKDFGGDGKSFDWSLLRKIGEMPPRWGIAGGIRIDNLKAAIDTGAHLIDVASGIEEVRGQKSVKLMREFSDRFKKFIAEVKT